MKHWPWSVALAAALGSAAPAAHADTYTVTTTADSGAGSLRQALLDANGHAGMDTIAFDIPGTGVHTIKPQSALPHVTDSLTIDGYTQPGSSPNSNGLSDGINAHLLVEIDLGEVSDVPVTNLRIDEGAAGSVIRGIVLNHFTYDGIVVAAAGVTIQGNFIGTNADGSATFASQSGACIRQEDGGTNLTIGGTIGEQQDDAPARNLLSTGGGGVTLRVHLQAESAPSPSGSAPAVEVIIAGNYIGTDAAGTSVLGDDSAPGIYLADHTAIVNNLIGGQGTSEGVVVNGQTLLANNAIGTQRDGASPMPNGHISSGAAIRGQNNIIAHNIIAFGYCAALKVDPLAIATITQNKMFSNNFGIDYGGNACGVPQPNQPGGSRNHPQISATVAGNVATVSGTINGTAATPITIEFFSNQSCNATGYGEGRTYIGSTELTTDASGNASFDRLLVDFPEGEAVITATATNDAGETSEFSQCATATVAPATTTTTLVSSLNPSTHGQTVTFIATVLPEFKRAAVAVNAPTGSVQFRDGAAPLGAPLALGADGTATFATDQLAVGTHAITAVYSGDADNATSTSAALAQIVNPEGGTQPTPSTPVPVLSFWFALALVALLGGVGHRGRSLRR